MSRSSAFAALLLLVGACGASGPSQPPASDGQLGRANVRSADRPFTVAEIATFDLPWAMDFLPGSGVPLTNIALVTEKRGRLC